MIDFKNYGIKLHRKYNFNITMFGTAFIYCNSLLDLPDFGYNYL